MTHRCTSHWHSCHSCYGHAFILLFLLALSLDVHSYETYDANDHIAEESTMVENRSEEADLEKHYRLPQQGKLMSNSTDHSGGIDIELNTTATPRSIHQSGRETPSDVTSAIDESQTTAVTNFSATTATDDPLITILPKIKFNCKHKNEGYFSDLDFCDIFHYCKANGYRFTFLCPSHSFYNNELMACEQNATEVAKCKSQKVQARDQIGLAESIDFQQPLQLKELPTQDISTKFESSRLSNHIDWEELQASVDETTVKQTRAKFSGQRDANQRGNHLSTTTLIPPSFFIEPTATFQAEPTTELLTSITDNNVDYLAKENLSTTPSTFASSLSTISIKPFHSNQSNVKGSQIELSFSSTVEAFPNMTMAESVTQSPLLATLSKSHQVAEKLNKPKKPIVSVTTRMPNFDNILKALDMSNYEMNKEDSQSNKSKRKKMYREPNGYGEVHLGTATVRPVGDSSGRLTLSIHKFFRESFPTHHWKSVPRFLKSLKGKEDFDMSPSAYVPMQSIPKKSDFSTNLIGGVEDYRETESISMLSIPVLVPVNLSQDDYRQRISASVLKPIVIPLKEKGKLIPAYVLQFTSSVTPTTSSNIFLKRSKRGALHHKDRKLLSLPIKPKSSLLSQIIPSLLKNIQLKMYGKNKSLTKVGLLKAGNTLVPLYSTPLPQINEAFLKHVASVTGKLGDKSYDIKDFHHSFPSYYFTDNNYLNALHAMQQKGSAISKQKMLNSKSNITSMGTMATSSSEASQQMVKPPIWPLPYFPANQVSPAYLGSGDFVNSPYPTPLSYYSPLMFFGNPVHGVRYKTKKNHAFKKYKQKGTISSSSSNVTMPANVYVPDEVFEELEVVPSGNQTATSLVNHSNNKRQSEEQKNHDDLIADSNTVEVSIRHNEASTNFYSERMKKHLEPNRLSENNNLYRGYRSTHYNASMEPWVRLAISESSDTDSLPEVLWKASTSNAVPRMPNDRTSVDQVQHPYYQARPHQTTTGDQLSN